MHWRRVVLMRLTQDAAKRVRDYTVPTDFCKVFEDHLDHLYTLSLLLTSDHHKAEQCFIGGLEDCLQGTPSFRRRARPGQRLLSLSMQAEILLPRRTIPT